MSVELAVELSMDEPSAARVTALMARLDAAGIPSLRQLAPHAHAHVSVAVASAGAEQLEAACAGLGDSRPDLPLAALGAFVSPARVVFLCVTPTPGLLALNESVHARLDHAGIPARSLYRPGSFVPHVTLAMHVASIPEAMSHLQDAPLPIEARGRALRLVEVPTGRLVATVA